MGAAAFALGFILRVRCEADSPTHTHHVDLSSPQAIWDHSGGQRKGMFPGAPDDYRETIYERDHVEQSYQVLHSIIEK